MKKYVFLIASLSAASAFAHGRDPASIGNRLGDGAYMKATGLSRVEWAAQCEHQKTRMSASHQLDGSVSAGSSSTANYSATMNDSVPADSLTDNHQLSSNGETATSSGRDISHSYSTDHTPIYTDKSDLSAAGAPAKSSHGSGFSEANPASLPVGGKVSSTVSSDVEWAARAKSDLTRASAKNPSATITTENLRNVNIHRANGVVTLTGTVPNENLKSEVETRIKQISGLDSINNELRVVPSADKPATPVKETSGSTPSDR